MRMIRFDQLGRREDALRARPRPPEGALPARALSRSAPPSTTPESLASPETRSAPVPPPAEPFPSGRLPQ